MCQHILDETLSDLNAKDLSELLKYPCYEGNIDLVKLLLEKGANINYATNCDETPGYIAAKNQNYNLLKFLVGVVPWEYWDSTEMRPRLSQ